MSSKIAEVFPTYLKLCCISCVQNKKQNIWHLAFFRFRSRSPDIFKDSVIGEKHERFGFCADARKSELIGI